MKYYSRGPEFLKHEPWMPPFLVEACPMSRPMVYYVTCFFLTTANAG